MRNTILTHDRSPLWNWIAGDVDDFFDRALSPRSDEIRRQVSSYDVEETEAGYLMTVDLPGVRKEDLKIEVVEKILTVTGQRKRSDGDGQKIFYRFSIPASADAGKIEANLENGVLEIAMPKAEAAKPRSVQIQSGATGVFSKLLGSSKKERDHEKTVQAG
ncbi:MAG: hypothetical protein C5B49_15035 [Bdellovibrio sp.]|nr:MAG: hypothetical protein C5B49_15035 [Bdellovibrio sp.]